MIQDKQWEDGFDKRLIEVIKGDIMKDFWEEALRRWTPNMTFSEYSKALEDTYEHAFEYCSEQLTKEA